jgi:hypothetical protein
MWRQVMLLCKFSDRLGGFLCLLPVCVLCSRRLGQKVWAFLRLMNGLLGKTVYSAWLSKQLSSPKVDP